MSPGLPTEALNQELLANINFMIPILTECGAILFLYQLQYSYSQTILSTRREHSQHTEVQRVKSFKLMRMPVMVLDSPFCTFFHKE
jgi:hypothetical protein